MVRVTSSTDPRDMMVLEAILGAEGIDCFVEHRHCGNEWLVLGAIRMFMIVPASEQERAREVVERYWLMQRMTDPATRRWIRRVLFWALGLPWLVMPLLPMSLVYRTWRNGADHGVAWFLLILSVFMLVPFACFWLVYRDMQDEDRRLALADTEGRLQVGELRDGQADLDAGSGVEVD